MNKLRDVHSRLSLKAVSRYSKLIDEEDEKVSATQLKKAGKSVNSIIPKNSAEKRGEENPFLSDPKSS